MKTSSPAFHYGGVDSINVKFLQESEEFAANQETWEIFQEAWSNEVKILGSLRFFWECLPKIRKDIPDFRENFDLHMILFKQRLLELSPAVYSMCFHKIYCSVSISLETCAVCLFNLF